MTTLFDILQRSAAALSASFAALLLLTACVDDTQIERTNTTLEANLNELKRLNESFNTMSSTMTKDLSELQQPIDAISQRFAELTKLVAEAGSGVPEAIQTTTRASEKLLGLLEIIPVDKIAEHSDDIETVIDGIAELSKTISGFMPTLEQLGRSGMLLGMFLAKQGLKLGTMSADEWAMLQPGFITMVETNQQLSAAAKSAIKQKLQESAELARDHNFMATVEHAAEKLDDLDERLASLDGEVDKFQELLDKFDLSALTSMSKDGKAFMAEVLALLPLLERTALNVTTMVKEMKDLKDGLPGFLKND